MANGTPRSYTNAIVSVGNSSRAVVRFSCVACAHELELANNNMRKHGSFYAQQARKRGWDTDGAAVNKVYCPDCRKTPAYRPRRQVELDGVVLSAMGEPPVIEGVVEEVPEPGVEVLADQRKWLEQTTHDISQAFPARAKEPAMARDLTPAQRLAIRGMLDKYFDDKEGCYLANDEGEVMNDQMVGSLAGVPWGEVTKIREAAYGKIMVDPALAALRTQMADLEKRLGEMRAALDGYGRKRAMAG